MENPREFLVSLFNAAVEAADADHALRNYLPECPRGRTIVVGAGKGVAQLARALERAWEGPLEGTVVTRYGYAVACERIEVLEASHPVPDEAGLKASERVFERVAGLTEDDLVISLICGGGSALLPAPADGLTLEDEIALNKELLKSGAPIAAMNAIRKQFSKIKGGRLALAAHPAKVVSLVVSDIPGDVASLVSSGPTIPDATTRQDAADAIARYRIELPDHMIRQLETATAAPDPNDPRFSGNIAHVVASAGKSLEAAAEHARAQSVEAAILSDSIEGEASLVGGVHASIAREVALRNRPFRKPVVILSGGETTVTLRGKGKGGRNTEFLLAFAIGIEGLDGVTALAADTDGIDGSEDNAGAFADGKSVAQMNGAGRTAQALLEGNDAWTAFEAADALFVPGPTGTNVNDFRAIFIE
ncbi:glycerate kinase [Sinorhizobium sp. 8-89]|uniref:glycerate kinase type-2 family protein n=1 Tax=Sinorhizobium sp. 7-81 TaxID=3049087 RepID=UPI0024C4131E|nr:glycerate kinase [Sinorhizobium sp. 7-81]MDK1386521.1 glycerate kinase [Sinorhizobium sp. 7-81]